MSGVRRMYISFSQDNEFLGQDGASLGQDGESTGIVLSISILKDFLIKPSVQMLRLFCRTGPIGCFSKTKMSVLANQHLCLVFEFHWRGSATNGATPSTLQCLHNLGKYPFCSHWLFQFPVAVFLDINWAASMLCFQ